MESKLIHGLIILLLAHFGKAVNLGGLELDTEVYKPLAKDALTSLFGRIDGRDLGHPKDPVIGLLNDDEVLFNATVNFTDSPFFSKFITGVINACGGKVSGLLSIVPSTGFTADDNGIYFNYSLNIGRILLTSNNDGEVSLLKLMNVTTYGDFEFELNDAALDIRITITLAPPDGLIVLEVFEIDILVGGVRISGDTLLNGLDIWELLFSSIGEIWRLVRPLVQKLLFEILHDLLAPCKIGDIVGGDFSCMNLGGGGGGIELPIEYPEQLTCYPRPEPPPLPVPSTEAPFPPSAANPTVGITSAFLVFMLSAVSLFLFH